MNKYRVAFVSVLMLLGTSAIAADWNSSFSTVDNDGNGSINRAEFTANEGKLDPTMNPTFRMMDKEQQRRSGRVVRGGKTEDGHRQGMYVVRQILVPVPEQS